MFDDIINGIADFLGGIADVFFGSSNPDPSDYFSGAMMPYHDYNAINIAFHERKDVASRNKNSATQKNNQL
jgi:hypothetical protein